MWFYLFFFDAVIVIVAIYQIVIDSEASSFLFPALFRFYSLLEMVFFFLANMLMQFYYIFVLLKFIVVVFFVVVFFVWSIWTNQVIIITAWVVWLYYKL